MPSPTPPTIEFRADGSPNGVLSSVSLLGSGYSGSIIAGSTSSVYLLRIYNNFIAAGGIPDAINCVLTSYDDATHQGSQVSSPVQQQWLNVNVISYNGTTTGGDGATYYPVGGFTKHAVPVNGGTLGGSVANYIQVNIKVIIPALATSTVVSQGLWLEYSYV